MSEASDRLDRIERSLESNDTRFDRIEAKLDTNDARFDKLDAKIDALAQQVERSNDKFDTYQKATQWVVQLAFTLIASATITVILSTVITR